MRGASGSACRGGTEHRWNSKSNGGVGGSGPVTVPIRRVCWVARNFPITRFLHYPSLRFSWIRAGARARARAAAGATRRLVTACALCTPRRASPSDERSCQYASASPQPSPQPPRQPSRAADLALSRAHVTLSCSVPSTCSIRRTYFRSPAARSIWASRTARIAPRGHSLPCAP